MVSLILAYFYGGDLYMLCPWSWVQNAIDIFLSIVNNLQKCIKGTRSIEFFLVVIFICLTFYSLAMVLDADGFKHRYYWLYTWLLYVLSLFLQDAKTLWERIQERQGVNKWRPDLEEEYEDLEGNVYNKKTYSDLQRQGLIWVNPWLCAQS